MNTGGTSDPHPMTTAALRATVGHRLVTGEGAAGHPPAMVPMPEAQTGLWYAQRLDPSNPIFNTAQYVDIRGPLDVAALRAAVDRAMVEADALSMRVVERMDGPALVADPNLRATLQVVDLRGHASPVRVARAYMRRDQRTPLDPTHDPLVAQRLFVLDDERYWWYQRIHHLVIDGYGTALLTTRVCELYASLTGEGASVGTPFTPFARVVADAAAYEGSERRESDRRFWIAAMGGLRDISGLVPGRAVTSSSYHRHGRSLAGTLSPAVEALATAAGVTWPDVLVALVSAYLQRHMDEREVVVGVPSMNRFGTPSARVPAMVMNVLPVRVPIDEDIPTAELVRSVSGLLREARKHGRYRGEQLRRDLGLVGADRRLHGALINVLPFDSDPVLPGTEARLRTLGTGPVDDLTVTIRGEPRGGRLRLALDGNPALYSAADIAAHTARLAAFLPAAARSASLATVPTLTAAERRHWIGAVNATEHAVDDTTLAELIERTMHASPSAPAVTLGDRTLTYGELDARSAALLAELGAHGVRRGDVVAVALPRSLELMVALVAILRAGAAYLPLDPEHPAARLASVLQSALPRLLIANEETGAARGAADESGTMVLLLDSKGAAAGRAATGSPHDARAVEPPRPRDAAYVIYTSGSTGTPKGVVVEHAAIVNRLEWMRSNYGLEPGERVLQKTPLTFDVSVWELFLPLISGATLVLAPPGAHRDPAAIAALIREHGISAIHFVPSMLSVFLDEPTARGLEIRRVFCSGEELSPALRDRFHATVKAELHNLYGPTEAAVDVTYWAATRDDRSAPVPIGRPVWNTRTYVLDSRQRPVAPGVTGELHLAGVQLARGYLGRPDLTAERFVPDPYGAAGERMYRTGDRARWRHDGALEFMGRLDNQVKIRGQRVEPGEVEAAILASGIATAVAVVPRADDSGENRLVAYIVPPRGAPPREPAELRGALARRLPEVMIPGAFVTMDALPLTSSGKLDRSALPDPAWRDAAPGRLRTAPGPATETEREIAGLFAGVLGLEPATIAATDDFFELGGHSLLAARLVTRLRARWPDVGFGTLFANPTVTHLAALLDSSSSGAAPDAANGHGTSRAAVHGFGPIIELASGDDRPPLFCIHPAGGLSWCYTRLARAMGPSRAVYGLQARGLATDQQLPERLDDMAADYVAQIRAIRPLGPYHLLGWSVGGIVAHAMAAQLAAAGMEVGVVALLDAYPSDYWRDAPEPPAGAALKALLHMGGLDAGQAPPGPLTHRTVMEMLRRADHPLGALSDELLAGVVRVVERNNRLVRTHRQAHYDGPIVHFRAALDHVDEPVDPQHWASYSASLETHEVPSLHAHMTGAAAVELVAAVLRPRI